MSNGPLMARKMRNEKAQIRRMRRDLGLYLGAGDGNRTRTVSLEVPLNSSQAIRARFR